MHNLIIKKGMVKKANPEDGPSFEQQFGILANALVVDKFPQLDSMRIAFQIIEKNEDNSEACGVTAYLVGANLILVPAFFKHNKLKTGDILYLPQSNQFLPLSDPWISWIKNKDLTDAGAMIPAESIRMRGSAKATTIKELADPIIKTACVYLKGLGRLPFENDNESTTCNVFDTIIGIGKKASEGMLDLLIKDQDILNSALAFYKGETVNDFAKKAAEMDSAEVIEVEIINPMDEEAKSLDEEATKELMEDGFYIKRLGANTNKYVPTVIKKPNLNNMFSVVNAPGVYKLLKLNGDTVDALVFRYIVPTQECSGYRNNKVYTYERTNPTSTRGYGDTNSAKYINMDKNSRYVAKIRGKLYELPLNCVALKDSYKPINPENMTRLGKSINNTGNLKLTEALFVTPSGYLLDAINFTSNSVAVSPNSSLKDWCIYNEDTLVLTPNTRVLSKDMQDDAEINNITTSFVTTKTLDAFLTEFSKKTYDKAKIYSDGQSFIVSGSKTDNAVPMSIKEAALHLIKDYGVEPGVAKTMLKEAGLGATYDTPKADTYYITKEAANESYLWEDSNLSRTDIFNKAPITEQFEMPSVSENPEELKAQISAAVSHGIKEVFDVSVLKLLIRQDKFFDEIVEDIPLFMQTLDSLCKKLFQFYWHTDKMEEKYGMVKMKALEESLKCTIDSLSELTIFFKVRTVDGSGVVSDTGSGDLV